MTATRILMVDDHTVIADAMSDVLTSEFQRRSQLLEVQVCGSVKESAPYLVSKKYDLIFLDLKLPDVPDSDLSRTIPLLLIKALDAAGKITDRRAGRIPSEESFAVVEKLQAVKIPGVETFVKPVKEHRFVVVFRGEGLDGAVADTDPQATGVAPLDPAPVTPAAQRTADIAKEFVRLRPQCEQQLLGLQSTYYEDDIKTLLTYNDGFPSRFNINYHNLLTAPSPDHQLSTPVGTYLWC
jgi:2,3-bisphosphoglycerate-independent phosphoglycerate mutase